MTAIRECSGKCLSSLVSADAGLAKRRPRFRQDADPTAVAAERLAELLTKVG